MRPLGYEFPHVGLAEVKHSFLVGPNLLVAPVLERGATSRTDTLPPGTWQGSDGERFDGGQVVKVPVDLMGITTFLLIDDGAPVAE
jgi:alpha-glucosidase (family GH31 glycosyl hydrolase)